jgi:hypothetical protein
MRILISLAFATVLVLAASVACTADLPQSSGNSASFQDNSHILGSPGVTTLKLSSMYVEIQAVLDQAGKKEQLLLKELAAATQDDEVERIIHRIDRLEVDSTLAILKIQIRYAQSEGSWDVVYRLRSRITEILENEAYVVQ